MNLSIWEDFQICISVPLTAQDLNKLKKNPEHPFVEFVKEETCAKNFSKKY